MTLQNFAQKNERIRTIFEGLKRDHPDRLKTPLTLSWSNWGFGMESLVDSACRLQKAGVKYIELHGNHYGPELGYRASEVLRILGDHDIQVAGVCGMFSPDNDLSSNRGIQRQAAIDYLKRTVPFAAETGGSYVLVVPGAVGRPDAYDAGETRKFARHPLYPTIP